MVSTDTDRAFPSVAVSTMVVDRWTWLFGTYKYENRVSVCFIHTTTVVVEAVHRSNYENNGRWIMERRLRIFQLLVSVPKFCV